MRKPLALLGVSAVVGFGVLAIGGPAYAADHYPTADWRVVYTEFSDAEKAAKPSSIVNNSTVELVGKGTVAPPHYGVSVESHNLNLTGDKVTVQYELKDGASSTAGAVRLFVYNTANANTMTDAPTKFDAATGTSGTLTVDAGFKIGTIGLVYDSSNSKADGKVVFRNLKVDSTNVLFKKPVVESPTPTPTKTATQPPTNTPGECAAYKYMGTNISLCEDFPNHTELNCTQAKWRVKLVDNSKDPWDLDGLKGGNRGVIGVGCESNPLIPLATVTPSTTTTPQAGLPVTGDGTGTKIAIGVGALVLGGAAILIFRKRRDTNFVAE